MVKSRLATEPAAAMTPALCRDSGAQLALPPLSGADLLGKETLDTPDPLSDNNDALITGQNWVDRQQVAGIWRLRAVHHQETDQSGDIPG